MDRCCAVATAHGIGVSGKAPMLEGQGLDGLESGGRNFSPIIVFLMVEDPHHFNAEP